MCLRYHRCQGCRSRCPGRRCLHEGALPGQVLAEAWRQEGAPGRLELGWLEMAPCSWKLETNRKQIGSLGAVSCHCSNSRPNYVAIHLFLETDSKISPRWLLKKVNVFPHLVCCHLTVSQISLIAGHFRTYLNKLKHVLCSSSWNFFRWFFYLYKYILGLDGNSSLIVHLSWYRLQTEYPNNDYFTMTTLLLSCHKKCCNLETNLGLSLSTCGCCHTLNVYR